MRCKSDIDLLPNSVRKNIPALYAQEDNPDPVVHAKFFSVWSNWTWYITEFDGKDTLFGLVVGLEVEFGYISLRELLYLARLGQVERDLYWTPKPVSQISEQRVQDHFALRFHRMELSTI